MNISAIILAAGQSKRMRQPKMVLPWEKTTVLGKVIETIKLAGIEDILVVTGGARIDVEEIVESYSARKTHNENYENEEMLASIQLGIKGQKAESEATLICLGDQPQVEEGCVRSICEAFLKHKSNIIVPSYQMHRGHPWLIAKDLWNYILQMQTPESMRDFLNRYKNEIQYVEYQTSSILQDIDTPEDYLKFKP